MKDNQQTTSLEVEVNNQNNMASATATATTAAAFKTLSPMADVDLYTLTNGDANEHEAELLLQSEEENGEDILEQPEMHSTNEISSETEDEILNKFDTDSLEKDVFQEDKLLKDLDEIESEMIKINGDTDALETDTVKWNGDLHETNGTSEHEPAVEDGTSLETILDESVAPVDVAVTEPILQNGHANDDELVDSAEPKVRSAESAEQNGIDTKEQVVPCDDSAVATEDQNATVELEQTMDTEDQKSPCNDTEETLILDDEAQIVDPVEQIVVVTEVQTVLSNEADEPAEEENINNHMENTHMETDDKTKEQQDAEFLKNQIMDTEDLLQIMDEKKETPNDTEAETDHEPEHDQDDDIDEEFESDPLVTDDDQIVKEEIEFKDADMDPICEDMSYSISNENSSCGDKDDVLVIDDKLSESDDKYTELVEQESEAVLMEESSLEEKIDEDGTKISNLKDDSEPKTPKRPASDTESQTETKKAKLLENDDCLSDQNKTQNEDPAWAQLHKLSSTNTFSDFVRNKSIDKLTRADLEEFCLQKMCEAVYHRSEIGELRHKLGVQEQMAEMWRKEVMQLLKQARDLEIVNKRLLNEVRLKTNHEKPLIPVKITRSVGLQVRCDSSVNVVTPKRRAPPPRAPPSHIVQSIAPKPPPVSKPSTTPVASTSKSITAPSTSNNTAKPATKIITSKANSLLTQALVNSSNSSNTNNAKSLAKTVTSTPVRVISSKPSTSKTILPKITTTATTTTAAKPTDKTFIDLTDEEDRRPQAVTTLAQTTTTNVRIVKAATNAVANSPRIMYVYNNQLHQGVLATDPTKPGGQKLMLKLNSNVNVVGQTNGVLATVPSSALAVGSSPLRTSQQVRFTTPLTPARTAGAKPPLKHPAPLPPPPTSQLNIAARKPIPPRPLLSIRRSSGGIVLSWKMPYNLESFETIASYQLYAYQETCSLPSSDMWRKVGDVKALALPMACTLTQFADGNKYHFAVRAVDVHKRMGQFSEPEQILL